MGINWHCLFGMIMFIQSKQCKIVIVSISLLLLLLLLLSSSSIHTTYLWIYKLIHANKFSCLWSLPQKMQQNILLWSWQCESDCISKLSDSYSERYHITKCKKCTKEYSIDQWKFKHFNLMLMHFYSHSNVCMYVYCIHGS